MIRCRLPYKLGRRLALHLHQGDRFNGANGYTGLTTDAAVITGILGVFFAVCLGQHKGVIGAGRHAIPTGFADIDVNRYEVQLLAPVQIRKSKIAAKNCLPFFTGDSPFFTDFYKFGAGLAFIGINGCDAHGLLRFSQ
jgi:hypothetical protein